MRQEMASPRLRTDLTAEDMVLIPGGTFLMGSDHHYAEEAPAHRVTVDPFWIDVTPVTNWQFTAFVAATGHRTTAEIAPRAEDYPGALPHMLRAGSLTFRPPAGPVPLGIARCPDSACRPRRSGSSPPVAGLMAGTMPGAMS